MKRLTLVLPFAALITACTAPSGPVTLASLQITGITGPLQISQPAQVKVTALGTDGQPFGGTPVFASSDPNVVTVAADGTLDVRHLSTTPVVITATEEGMTVSQNVTTYGLDVTGGTYHDPVGDGSPDTYMIMAFRDISGNTNANDSTVHIIYNDNHQKSGDVTLFAKSSIGSFSASYGSRIAGSGAYTGKVTVNNTVYSKNFSLDYNSFINCPTMTNFKTTKTNYSVDGVIPFGVAEINFVITDGISTQETPNISSLPASGVWNTPLAPGTQSATLIGRSYDNASGKPFPDKVNYCYYFGTSTVIH